MSLKIVRNDITEMDTDAIVNTANEHVEVGPGCDRAIYERAGFDQLLEYRREHVGDVEEGKVFITPGFNLKAKYIIHAVSPLYIDGEHGEEEKLRSCYRSSLEIARSNEIKSIAFPLIATGSFGYPKEDGLRIAVDEINAFLLKYDMEVYIVVFSKRSTESGSKIYPNLESYIDQNYVDEALEREYSLNYSKSIESCERVCSDDYFENSCLDEIFEGESELDERIKHIADSFGDYAKYIISRKGLSGKQVQDNGWISKQVYSKVVNNNQHPEKRTAYQICVGLGLNLDETKDMIRRAGYDFSPCDIEDIIWKFFFEKGLENYDIFDISDALEKYGFKPIVVLKMK